MAGSEYVYPRRSSLTRSPDTLSPVYPDRPIRPLPSSRLRSKLSPEAASQIVYPKDAPVSSPLFSFPYGLANRDDGGHASRRQNGHPPVAHSHCTCGGEHGDGDSEEEEGVYDHPSYRWASPVGADGAALDAVQRKVLDASRGAVKPPPPPASIASSADGYESFENTSNKKKRKIPLSGGSSAHQSSLSADLANMGLSSHASEGAADDMDGDGHHHHHHHHGAQHPPAGAAISGPGRGRYGRQSARSERRPLGASSNAALNGYASSLSARSRGGNWKGDGTKTKEDGDQGIISAAIANAAEQQPATPQKGAENVSLLSQQSSRNSTPKTQFTFTCESDSSNMMSWPGPNSAPYSTPTHSSQPAAGYTRGGMPPGMSYPAPQAHHGTQTAPNVRGVPPLPPQVPGVPPPMNTAPPRKPRPRRPSKEYAAAARQRQVQQDYTNYHHKPTKDTMWICEFCEYEDIWGTRPEALIRQYEIKDRAERKKTEERRRLLEKAKLKNRKPKKGAKNGNKNAAQQPASSTQPYDHPLDNVPLPSDAQGDEYYDDDYDDGYDPVSPSVIADPHYAANYSNVPPGPGAVDTGQPHPGTLPPAPAA